jgi:hypothetical protein
MLSAHAMFRTAFLLLALALGLFPHQPAHAGPTSEALRKLTRFLSQLPLTNRFVPDPAFSCVRRLVDPDAGAPYTSIDHTEVWSDKYVRGLSKDEIRGLVEYGSLFAAGRMPVQYLGEAIDLLYQLDETRGTHYIDEILPPVIERAYDLLVAQTPDPDGELAAFGANLILSGFHRRGTDNLGFRTALARIRKDFEGGNPFLAIAIYSDYYNNGPSFTYKDRIISDLNSLVKNNAGGKFSKDIEILFLTYLRTQVQEACVGESREATHFIDMALSGIEAFRALDFERTALTAKIEWNALSSDLHAHRESLNSHEQISVLKMFAGMKAILEDGTNEIPSAFFIPNPRQVILGSVYIDPDFSIR